MPEIDHELYAEFERASLGRTHEDIARNVERFASNYGSEILAAVYDAGWSEVRKLCERAPGAYSVGDTIDIILRLSYGLGVLSKHVHPVRPSDDSGMRRKRNIVM